MNELTYEDVDDEGNSVLAHNLFPKWQTDKIHHWEVLAPIFKMYHRKYFASADEQKAWKRICKAIDKGMQQAWIDNCVAWVKLKMEAGGYIQFWTLENLILNAVREREWLAKNKMASRELDVIETPEQEDVIETGE